MRRGVLIGLIVTGVLCVVLMVAVAQIGTQLDQARIEREDLRFEVEDLRNESQSLKTERDALKRQVSEKLNAIEQMKAEAETARAHRVAPPDSLPAPSDAAQPTASDHTQPGKTPAAGSSQ